MFAHPVGDSVVLRLSVRTSAILSNDFSTPRGLATKVIGVEAQRLPGTAADVTG